jgi:hypothetical protein
LEPTLLATNSPCRGRVVWSQSVPLNDKLEGETLAMASLGSR